MTDDGENERVRAAIAGALGEAVPGIVTRWVALVEVLGDDGQRVLWLQAQDGQRAWDTLGLLTFGVQLEQAEAVRALLGDDE